MLFAIFFFSLQFLELQATSDIDMASVAATTTPLATFGQTKFDLDTLETFAGAEVAARFRECLITGEKSSPADVKAIEGALFKWCSSHGCINYAHW